MIAAGNWQRPDFAWGGTDRQDAADWLIYCTNSSQSSLLAEVNARVFEQQLAPYTQGSDPDVIFESYHHWMVGTMHGFSLRAVRGAEPTQAFVVFSDILRRLEDDPVLDREALDAAFRARTEENYRDVVEIPGLPGDWPARVFDWFSGNRPEKLQPDVDDRGGTATRTEIRTALAALGLFSSGC